MRLCQDVRQVANVQSPPEPELLRRRLHGANVLGGRQFHTFTRTGNEANGSTLYHTFLNF